MWLRTGCFIARRSILCGTLAFAVSLAGHACGAANRDRVWRTTGLGVYGSNPIWSTKAGLLAFERKTGTHESWIWVVALDGSKCRRLAEGRQPSWAPDGKRIAYCAAKKPGEHAYYTPAVYSLETGKRERFNRFSTYGSFPHIVWTADGRGIVFPVCKPASAKGDVGYPWWVYMPLESRPASTIEIVPIRESPRKGDPPVLWDLSFGMQGAAFAWATHAWVKSGPGSANVVEAIGIRYGVPTGDDDAAITPAMLSEGGVVRRTDARPRHPAWHPVAPVLLFDALGCLWRMDVLQRTVSLFWPKDDSGSLRGQAAFPSFSATGDRVAFVLRDGSRTANLVCVDRRGRRAQLVYAGVAESFRGLATESTPFAWGPGSDCLIFVAEDGELTVATCDEQQGRSDPLP